MRKTKLQGIDPARGAGEGSVAGRPSVARMDDAQVFAGSARLRRELAEWLPTLSAEQLATRSLCTEWTVREVAGHITASVTVPLRALFWRIVRCRFDPDRAVAELATEVAAQPLPELVAALREHADDRFAPPVVGPRAPLTDLLVHRADMRIPLGQPSSPEPELVGVALDFLAPGRPGFAPKRRLAGLRLVATDLDRTWGDGAELAGPGADLMLAVCGRRAGLAALRGPGAALLAARI